MTALIAHAPAIPVAFARDVMGGDVWRDVRPQGQSLAEIVASVPGLPAWFEDFGMVCVDGTPAPKRYWSRRPGGNTRRLVPKASATRPLWVTLHVRPMGGDEGGAKNVIAIVASVALIAVGAFITGGALGPAGLGLFGGLFSAGSTSAAILAAGVTTLGRLAITLLSPPAARDKRQDNSAPVLGSAGAQGNALAPGGAIPRVCGRIKIFPPFASLPLIELSGDDETVEASYILAGPHKIEDLRAEGAKVEDITGVQLAVNEGLSASLNSVLNRYGLQRSPNFELASHRYDQDVLYRLRTPSNPDADLPSWRIEVTATDPDEIWIQITWPTGLSDTDGYPVLVAPLRLRMRILGTSDWINLPELHFANNKSGAITKKVVLKWAASPAPLVDQADIHGAWESFHTVPAQDVAPLGLGGWSAHASFIGTATPYNAVARVERRYDGFTVFLDETAFPRGNRWEVGLMRGHVFKRGDFTPATYLLSWSGGPSIASFFDYTTDGGLPRILFGRKESTLDRVVLSRFASVKNQPPLTVPGHATIEIRARNVQLAQLSCIASAYVPDWNGSEWTGSVASSNPAVHLAHIMTGNFTEDPVLPQTIRNAEIVAFRQRCADQGYEVAMAIDGQNWFEAMQAVASCGFGRVRAGTRWGVAFDRDSSADLGQHFSPRNGANFVLEKSFSALEDAFRVSFRNRATGWEQDERLVIRTGLTRADVRRITAVNAVGLDTAAQIDRRFGYDLLAQELRDYTLSFDVPPEGLVSQMGDVVAVTHPVLSRHHRAARIAEVLTDGGGLVTGLVLDNSHEEGEPTPIGSLADAGAVQDFGFQGVPLAACIVCSDLSEITREIVQTPGEQSRVTFAAPFASSVVARQCMVAIGEAEEVTERLVIREVRPTRRFTMRITAIPEAPELWS